jgi:tight adherence protein C
VDATHHGGRRVTAFLPAAWALVLAVAAWNRRPPRVASAARRTRSSRSLDAGRVATLGLAVAVVVAPLWCAALLLLAVVVAPPLLVRRSQRRRDVEVARSLPEVVDLFDLAVGAGLNVTLAVEAVARRATGPLADELVAALDDVRLGRRLADALSEVPDRAGEVVRPLVDALVSSDRYGARLGDALPLLASEVRADRRRRAEEIARRVPVKLLFPLVCCVLPAFGLLTLAPLIAGAAAALRH